MIPPRKAMSLPARMGTCRSAIALVRLKRGSTWITLAPRSLASITHWKPTGCAAAERGPQTGDGRGVSYPRLVLDLDGPERGEQLLDEVVLLVVQGRPAEAGHSQRAVDPAALLVVLLPGLLAGLDDPVGDHLHGPLERELLPLGAMGPPVLDLGLAQRGGDQALGRRALGAEATARDRAVGVALDLGDLLVLHEHELAATDRAVGADRADHPVRLLRARGQRPRPLRLGAFAEPEGIPRPHLPHQRQRPQQPANLHLRSPPPASTPQPSAGTARRTNETPTRGFAPEGSAGGAAEAGEAAAGGAFAGLA